MGVRIEDLRFRVRPIAERLTSDGFTMTDLLSIGMLFLEDKEPNEISRLIKQVNRDSNEEKTRLTDDSDLKRAAMAVMTIFEGQKGQRVIMSEKDRKVLADLQKTIGPAVKKARKAN